MNPEPTRLPSFVPGLVFGALLFLPLTATANSLTNDADSHEHTELVRSDSLTLAAAIRAAQEKAPVQGVPQAHQREGDVLQRRGGQWLSAAPAVQWRYQTDAYSERNNPATSGLREQEVGIELPLWRWGQRDAAQAEGEQAQAYARHYRQWQAWQVAGEVRDLFWQEQLQAWLVTQAEADVVAFKALERDIERKVKAGEVAPLERLIAENARRERELLLHEAESQHIDLQFRWRTLTGLAALPLHGEEVQTSESKLWPPLLAAQAWAARQQELVKGLNAQGSGSPKLLLGSRRERAQNDVVDSVGITVTLPFAGQTHAQAQHLPAQLMLADAEDSVRREQRASSMAHHEAHHELNSRASALQQLTTRLALAEQEIRLTRKAWQLGETSLQERLLGEQRFADIARQHGSARIAYQWAIARFNQAQGVTP